jgi:hypothetical protein
LNTNFSFGFQKIIPGKEGFEETIKNLHDVRKKINPIPLNMGLSGGN